MATSHFTTLNAPIPRKLSARLHHLENARRRRLDDPELLSCSYCGAVATTIDHVPPRSMRAQLVDLGIQFDAVEIPACRECNGLLGAKPFLTLTARKAYIKRRLRRQYAELLKIPDWSDADLAQVSPAMRGYILNGILLRDFIRERLKW
jgi:hypothetical protein